MRKIVTFAAAVLMAATGLAQSWPEMLPEARPGVRWYVFGSAFTREDVVWSLDEYARAGLGYLELTPIYGVEGNEDRDIPFLSEEWMEMYKFIVREAGKRGIVIDMAMGSGWVFGGPTTPLSEAACKLSYTDVRAGRQECRNLDVSLPNKKEMSFASLCRVMAYGSDGTVTDVTSFVKGSVLDWRKAKRGRSRRRGMGGRPFRPDGRPPLSQPYRFRLRGIRGALSALLFRGFLRSIRCGLDSFRPGRIRKEKGIPPSGPSPGIPGAQTGDYAGLPPDPGRTPL